MKRARDLAASLALVATLTPGCGLPLASEETPTQNVCTSDADCGDGICTAVGATNRCVATEADLAGIVFQLEGTTVAGSRVSHVFEKGISLQGERAEGVVVGIDLDVPLPLLLTGRFLHPDRSEPGACPASDGTVPVTVEARTSRPLVGLEQVFTGISSLITNAEGTSHQFELPVAPGTYDVYVVPQAADGCVALPPRIFPAVEVEADVKLEPEAEAPRRLTGVVTGGALSLDGFRVELLEPKRGLPVSEVANLAPLDGGSPLLGGPSDDDERGVAYYYTEGLVLRLSDADGRLVVHWKFDALDFDGDDVVDIDLGDLIADQKVLRATVLGPDERPVPAVDVTIKSLSLTGGAGKNSSFRVAAQSDAAGVVEVALVPGTYQVVLVPPDGDDGTAATGAAQLEDEWIVAEDAQCCGKTFVLPPRPLLTGSVRTGVGDVVPAVPVLATPTLPGVRDYFSRALGVLDVLPRQAAATTDASGLFAMAVDAGTYDVTVRGPSGTGHPWLVLPATVVAPVEQQPGAPLGAMILPSPAVIVGGATLQTPSGVEVAAGAVVRAYLPLADAVQGAPARVVAIGEVVTDDGGRFELPLPPSIARGTRSPTSGAGGGAP